MRERFILQGLVMLIAFTIIPRDSIQGTRAKRAEGENHNHGQAETIGRGIEETEQGIQLPVILQQFIGEGNPCIRLYTKGRNKSNNGRATGRNRTAI